MKALIEQHTTPLERTILALAAEGKPMREVGAACTPPITGEWARRLLERIRKRLARVPELQDAVSEVYKNSSGPCHFDRVNELPCRFDRVILTVPKDYVFDQKNRHVNRLNSPSVYFWGFQVRTEAEDRRERYLEAQAEAEIIRRVKEINRESIMDLV